MPGPPVFTGFLRDITERQRSEQSLRTLAAEQAALRRVATTVASETSEERVFAVVTEELGRVLGGHTANTMRYEPDGTAVVVGEWSRGERAQRPGRDARARSTARRPPRGSSAAAARSASRTTTSMEGEHAEMLRALGFRSAVGAPIKLGGRLWGAVAVSTVEETPFPAGAEQRIADFAELVALALANAEARRELAASRARIVETGDAERRRLERNLHDGAQQRLVVAGADAAAVRAGRASTAPRCEHLQRGADGARPRRSAELRELARGIHPAILTDQGLVPALEMLVGRCSVPVELSAALDDRLPEPVEAAAYYIVAEALTNASKHAAAERVRVDVRQVDGEALVEVADDGVGGADAQGGSGLRGLGDRVDALGGRLELESPPARHAAPGAAAGAVECERGSFVTFRPKTGRRAAGEDAGPQESLGISRVEDEA